MLPFRGPSLGTAISLTNLSTRGNISNFGMGRLLCCHPESPCSERPSRWQPYSLVVVSAASVWGVCCVAAKRGLPLTAVLLE